ncbi:MAG: nickel pincer cofactor biosynthesis protein LarC [Acidiferrobacterales bacterium]
MVHSHSSAHTHRHGHGHDAGPLREDLERGCGRGKLLFLDAFSGIAGDMLVAALLDLGVPRAVIDSALAALPLGGYRIELDSAVRSGIVARRFVVHVDETQPERDYAQIRAMLEAAHLPEGTRAIALDAFRTLAQAEATVHRVPVDHVHFHEVGAVDSIVDIVAAAAALDWLSANVVVSPLPMGRGTVRARHGVLPLPAPATVECLRGVPTYDAGIDAELVTPTGACLVATCARGYARWPEMRPEQVGWGGGTHELPDRPNLLRVVLGRSEVEEEKLRDAPFAVLEANVDDMTAEVAAHAVERLLAADALDAWTVPIVMKKGRPAMMITALVRRDEVDASVRLLLSETTSLGVRVRPVYRVERPRRILEVETLFGRIPVKVADGDGLPPNLAPEFEACRAAASSHGVPVKEVFAAALVAARAACDATDPE